MSQEQITVKLVFPFGSVTAESLPKLLSKYTKDFNIANFMAKSEIGKNNITFAVVDLPSDVVPRLFADRIISDVDTMAGNDVKCSRESNNCSSGNCCKK